MRIQKSNEMRGYHCSALRLLPLFVVLGAVFMTSVVAHSNHHYGPEIITYGDCPHGAGQHLPYRIQTPLPPRIQQPSAPPAPCNNPFEKKSYGYNIDGVEDPRQPSSSGVQLPVSIQQPVLPPYSGPSSPPAYYDPLRGKSYGIGIQPGPSSPDNTPSLGQYDFGVQKSIPAPNRPAPAAPSGPYRDPLGVEVQPAASPNQESPLWGSLPIGIQRPAESRSGPGNAGPAGPAPRLQGLTSNIDKLLLPVNCPIPMDGSDGEPSGGGYPGGNGPLGGGGYPGGNGPLGGGGYPGGNGPLGGGGYPGGNGPYGAGSGYPGGNGPYGAGNGYPGGNGPFGGSGYAGGNGPLGGGGGYPGGNGPSGGGGAYPGGNGRYPASGYSSCGGA